MKYLWALMSLVLVGCAGASVSAHEGWRVIKTPCGRVDKMVIESGNGYHAKLAVTCVDGDKLSNVYVIEDYDHGQ